MLSWIWILNVKLWRLKPFAVELTPSKSICTAWCSEALSQLKRWNLVALRVAVSCSRLTPNIEQIDVGVARITFDVSKRMPIVRIATDDTHLQLEDLMLNWSS